MKTLELKPSLAEGETKEKNKGVKEGGEELLVRRGGGVRKRVGEKRKEVGQVLG